MVGGQSVPYDHNQGVLRKFASSLEQKSILSSSNFSFILAPLSGSFISVLTLMGDRNSLIELEFLSFKKQVPILPVNQAEPLLMSPFAYTQSSLWHWHVYWWWEQWGKWREYKLFLSLMTLKMTPQLKLRFDPLNEMSCQCQNNKTKYFVLRLYDWVCAALRMLRML